MARPRKNEIETATTQRILTAAQRHFAKFGFDAAKLADIAKDAGITRPSLLYHFESKEKLYNAVVEEVFASLQQLFSGISTGEDDFRTILEGFTRAYVDFLEENEHVPAIVLREFAGDGGRGQEIVTEQMVPLLDWVENIVTQMGRGIIRDGLPVRAAIMQIATDALVRAMAKSMRDKLWGPHSQSVALSSILFFGES